MAARRSGFQPDRVVPPGSPPPPRSQPDGGAASELAEARAAFRQADYKEALKLARQVAERPQPQLNNTEPKEDKRKARDAEVQQFLSLVYFSQGDYEAATTSVRVALDGGTHWNWKTLSGHYAKAAEYTAHLRALENSIREKSTAEKRLLVGCHYLMLGQKQAARRQFQRAAAASADDKMILKMLRRIESDESTPDRPDSGN